MISDTISAGIERKKKGRRRSNFTLRIEKRQRGLRTNFKWISWKIWPQKIGLLTYAQLPCLKNSFLYDQSIRRKILGCSGGENTIESMAKKIQKVSFCALSTLILNKIFITDLIEKAYLLAAHFTENSTLPPVEPSSGSCFSCKASL